MRKLRLFSIAALALAMAACSNEDSALENAAPAQQQGAMKFTATLAAPGSGATTRTVYTEVTSGDDAGKIKVAWKAGDQIYLLDMDNYAECTATVGTPAASGSATISGTFNQQVEAGYSIIAVYPASFGEAPAAFNAKFASQAGTLAYIQDNLDLRRGTSTISVSGDQATLATALEMESQIAIWKLTLQNSSSEALSATKVTIKKGSTVIAATTDITATSEVYLALSLMNVNISGADITIEATVGSETYTYSKSGVSLAKGNYYQSTVKMTKASVPVTAITLNKTATTISVGSTETLSVTAVAPDNATDKTYTWKTSDASKATVDQDGKVTAIATGTVTIYAEANDGSGVKGSCTVTVTPKLYSFDFTGPYSGATLKMEFCEGDTWNDMAAKYPTYIKTYSNNNFVSFYTDGFIRDSNNKMVIKTAQIDPNTTYTVQ